MCDPISIAIGTAIAGSFGATVGTAAAATGVAGIITAGTAAAIGATAIGATALGIGAIGMSLGKSSSDSGGGATISTQNAPVGATTNASATAATTNTTQRSRVAALTAQNITTSSQGLGSATTTKKTLLGE